MRFRDYSLVVVAVLSAISCTEPSSEIGEPFRAPAIPNSVDGVAFEAGNWEPHLPAGAEGLSWGNHRAVVVTDETEGADEDSPGFDDPMYQDAVKVVLEAGKASTSTLQRRLRLGYGRAASILDAMEKDGIIGPPNGPRPREVIKPPDWLAEVETQ